MVGPPGHWDNRSPDQSLGSAILTSEEQCPILLCPPEFACEVLDGCSLYLATQNTAALTISPSRKQDMFPFLQKNWINNNLETHWLHFWTTESMVTQMQLTKMGQITCQFLKVSPGRGLPCPPSPLPPKKGKKKNLRDNKFWNPKPEFQLFKIKGGK